MPKPGDEAYARVDREFARRWHPAIRRVPGVVVEVKERGTWPIKVEFPTALVGYRWGVFSEDELVIIEREDAENA